MVFQKFIFLAGCFGLLSGIACGSQSAQVEFVVQGEQLQRQANELSNTLLRINNRVQELENWTLQNIEDRLDSGQYELSSKYQNPSDLTDNLKHVLFLRDHALSAKAALVTHAKNLISSSVMSAPSWGQQYANASRLITRATSILKRLEQAEKVAKK